MTANDVSSFRQAAKLRIEDLVLLDRAGSFSSYARTELINGTIIVVNAQHRPHARAWSLLFRRIASALEELGSDYEAMLEPSVAMPPHNLPQPDIVVTNEPAGEGFVPVGSVAMLVEVAESTLADDLGVKAQLYAEHGVPEYWVVDLEGEQLHQLWAPSPGGYTERRSIELGQPAEALTIERLLVDTTGLVAGRL
jgi:Uma2 family endonuclease